MTGRGLLLHELEWITGNCCRLVEQIRLEDLEWRPAEGLRSVGELANHLAQIPSVDLRIMKGDSQEAVQELEDNLWRERPRAWCGVMREGNRDLCRFMERLSMDEYENGSGTAFYGRTQTYAQWLFEAIAHVYHHRAQLFMYLRLKGYELDATSLWA